MPAHRRTDATWQDQSAGPPVNGPYAGRRDIDDTHEIIRPPSWAGWWTPRTLPEATEPVTVSHPTGVVEATVNADGRLVGLRLRAEASLWPVSDLAAEILRVTDAAWAAVIGSDAPSVQDLEPAPPVGRPGAVPGGRQSDPAPRREVGSTR